ncbi:unnamed protein product [Leptosia nina]|uniref:Uncharacterized protein n=1 Tax=Leptosia nina TaxID=320188 RepID=A0AAV1JXQ9_9NEOP
MNKEIEEKSETSEQEKVDQDVIELNTEDNFISDYFPTTGGDYFAETTTEQATDTTIVSTTDIGTTTEDYDDEDDDFSLSGNAIASLLG